MHELSIALDLLSAAQSELSARGGGRLQSIRVRVGELAGVEPDLLGLAWGAATKGGAHEGTDLDIEWVAAEQNCPRCGAVPERQPGSWLRLCPGCASPLRVEGGSELHLVELGYVRDDPREVPS